MEGEKQQLIQLNPSQARKAKPSEYFVRPYHSLISGRKKNSEEMMPQLLLHSRSA